MLVVSCLGLVFNTIMFKILHSNHGSGLGHHKCHHNFDNDHNHNNDEDEKQHHNEVEVHCGEKQ